MPDPVIEARGLTKYYGTTVGVESLDLTIEPGEVFGFLGPNGAGKTTTIRLLLDLIRPTRGSARLFGRSVADPDARRDVGYLPGDLALDPRMSGRAMLRYLDALRAPDAPPTSTRHRGELCERLYLTHADLERPIRDDSRGTRQRLGLVAAFQHDPALLVLDEPTASLDPLVREAVFELLNDAGRAGRTVFHSSHVLTEVDRTCTRVGILRDGRLVALERVEAMRRMAARKMTVQFHDTPPVDELAVPGVTVARVDGSTVELTVSGELDSLLRVLAGHSVRDLAFREPSLEEAFVRYFQPGTTSDGRESA